LTVRSTFLTERWDFERSVSCASSWDSSCFLLESFDYWDGRGGGSTSWTRPWRKRTSWLALE
jgi:hypothetical protein